MDVTVRNCEYDQCHTQTDLSDRDALEELVDMGERRVHHAPALGEAARERRVLGRELALVILAGEHLPDLTVAAPVEGDRKPRHDVFDVYLYGGHLGLSFFHAQVRSRPWREPSP